MGKAKKFLIVISVIVVLVGVIGLLNSYNNLQNAQKEVTKADAEQKSACQGVKDAILNPDLPTADYQDGLASYNDRCAALTGALK